LKLVSLPRAPRAAAVSSCEDGERMKTNAVTALEVEDEEFLVASLGPVFS